MGFLRLADALAPYSSRHNGRRASGQRFPFLLCYRGSFIIVYSAFSLLVQLLSTVESTLRPCAAMATCLYTILRSSREYGASGIARITCVQRWTGHCCFKNSGFCTAFAGSVKRSVGARARCCVEAGSPSFVYAQSP